MCLNWALVSGRSLHRFLIWPFLKMPLSGAGAGRKNHLLQDPFKGVVCECKEGRLSHPCIICLETWQPLV